MLQLTKKYYLLRHAQSIPNRDKYMCSTLQNGIKPENGLTPIGITQAELVGELFGLQNPNFEFTMFCSPFSRTVETANIFCKNNSTKDFRTSVDIIERGVGEFELQDTTSANPDKLHNAHYNYTDFGFESLGQLETRVLDFLTKVESDSSTSQNIVICSHGDILVIIDAMSRGIGFLDVPYIQNAEIRKIRSTVLLPFD